MKMTAPIKIYKCYDVVKVPFPFTDVHATKVRPALVLSHSHHLNERLGVSVMAMITSMKSSQELWPSDIIIRDLVHAGLPAPSFIRFKLFTLDYRLVLGRVGVLSKSDYLQVQEKLKEILAL